jgi:hypothetical protein
MFKSLLLRENKATSAPEMVKVMRRRRIRIITRKVEYWGLTVNNVKES